MMSKNLVLFLFFTMLTKAYAAEPTVEHEKTMSVTAGTQWSFPPTSGSVVNGFYGSFERALTKDLSLTVPLLIGGISNPAASYELDGDYFGFAISLGLGLKYYFSHHFFDQSNLRGFFLKPELHLGYSMSGPKINVEGALYAGYSYAFNNGLTIEGQVGGAYGYYGKSTKGQHRFGYGPKIAAAIGYAF